jgi:hypothetical protein
LLMKPPPLPPPPNAMSDYEELAADIPIENAPPGLAAGDKVGALLEPMAVCVCHSACLCVYGTAVGRPRLTSGSNPS